MYAKIQRNVYIELPKDDEMHGKMLGKLRLCRYGTAAKGWQETSSARLDTIGLKRGTGHPCVFHFSSRDIKTLLHGDDYVSAGSDESMDWLEAELAKACEIQRSWVARAARNRKSKSSIGY